MARPIKRRRYLLSSVSAGALLDFAQQWGTGKMLKLLARIAVNEWMARRQASL